MVKRLRWIEIPGSDFEYLEDIFSRARVESLVRDILIDLVEKYKSFSADYDGKRFVFVSVRNMERRSRRLAGFIIYDKSSKRILFGTYGLNESYFFRFLPFILRLATDGRFDIIEDLIKHSGFKEINVAWVNDFSSFLAFSYEFLGDEFIDYLYRNYEDIAKRYRENKLIYGKDFMYIPSMKIGLIRLRNGSIILYISPVYSEKDYKVITDAEPLIHRFLSGLIDYAEELERNMALYFDECVHTWCEYYVISSASPPSWWGKTTIMFTGKLFRDLSGKERLDDNKKIYFIDCDRYCSIHTLSDIKEYVLHHRSYSTDRLGGILRYLEHYYHGMHLRFLEHIIGFKERFPPKFVEEALEKYLHMNVMNVS